MYREEIYQKYGRIIDGFTKKIEEKMFRKKMRKNTCSE